MKKGDLVRVEFEIPGIGIFATDKLYPYGEEIKFGFTNMIKVIMSEDQPEPISINLFLVFGTKQFDYSCVEGGRIAEEANGKCDHLGCKIKYVLKRIEV